MRGSPRALERTSYQRLSAQDASFLFFERPATPMHVGAVAVFETGPLKSADGGVDIERLTKYVESRLHLLSRYRRRLAFTPLEGNPIWIDDRRFDVHYHVRRVGVPHPGDDRALKELVGRILSQPLDRERPLWEMWIVDGLEGDRFAIVSKVHHCMVDGASGANLLTMLFNRSPDPPEHAAPSWNPIPPPSPRRLVLDDAARGARLPLGMAAAAFAALWSPRRAWDTLAETGASLGEALTAGLRLPPPTPLNRPIGPHRRTEWRWFELDAVKEAKRRLGGSVNDVVLATVAGGLRHFADERGDWPVKLDYRIVVPVNMRRPDDDFSAANRVSALFLSLPVGAPDPLRRYAAIRTETRRLKDSRAAQGTDLLTRFADWAGGTWLTRLGTQLVSRLSPYHLIVTNVPGPQFPLYVLGARLLEMFPLLPLFRNQGLGVAVLSYDGKLGYGLVGDWELIPDLGRLGVALERSFGELCEVAQRRGSPTRGCAA